MSQPRLRVGVIGAGVGALHLSAYAQLPQVDIVALAGLDDDRVRRVAAEYQVPQTYREYEHLLAAPDIDAVSVCLPNVLHAPVSIAALRAGKHVLVEKPLARNAEEARAIAEAAHAHDRVLMVSFDKRYRNDVQWIRQYIDSGALGRIYYAKAHWMRRAGIPRLGSWFVSKEQAGGGPLIDLGVHVLDMAMYLLGEPRPLAAKTEIELLRIAQESFSNVSKYAQAAHVWTALVYGSDTVTLSIKDDGVGFDPSVPPTSRFVGGGFGLTSMRERAQLIGAKFKLNSAPGHGTYVSVTVPVAGER